MDPRNRHLPKRTGAWTILAIRACYNVARSEGCRAVRRAERGAVVTKPFTVLIVDDDAGGRLTLEAQLQGEPCQLRFATGGREVMQVMEGPPCDLVLCDVMMPVINGFEVCRRLKANDTWRFVPILLITALDGQDDLVRGLEAGAEDFLTKPVDGVVLRARVRALLRVRDNYNALLRPPANAEELLRARRERLVANAGLTPREREVLDLLLLGRTQQEIGLVLEISARTAKFHQENVLAKLGADGRVDLIRIFI